MKAKITRTDGIVIEVEGTPEEIRAFLPQPAPVPVDLGEALRKFQDELEKKRASNPGWPWTVTPYVPPVIRPISDPPRDPWIIYCQN